MTDKNTKKPDSQTILEQLFSAAERHPLAKEFSQNMYHFMRTALKGKELIAQKFKQAAIACNLFIWSSRFRIHCNGDGNMNHEILLEMCIKAGTVKELYRRRLIDRREMEAALLRITKSYGKELSYEERSGILQSEYR